MLDDTPEVVEADRVTGEDCFLAKVVVSDVHELEIVVDRFQTCCIGRHGHHPMLSSAKAASQIVG